MNADLIHEYYHVSGVAAVLREYMQDVRIDKWMDEWMDEWMDG